MEDLSLHILDIAENAVRAGANTIRIEIVGGDSLTVRIEDDGKGMDPQTCRKAVDPFYTTKPGKRVGLGLALLAQSAEETGGELKIESQVGAGTRVTAVFRPDHPDMRPMGDIIATMKTLIAANPAIRFVFDYRDQGEDYHFDSAQTP